MPAIRDHRGEVDPYGNELFVTQMAVVDELAAAGELIKGKCDQVPVAVVRGYLAATRDDDEGARTLVRDASMDLFSLGTAEARAAGLRAAATLADRIGPEPADPAAVRRAIDAVADVVAPGTVFTHVTDDEVRAGLAATVPGWPASATGLLLGAAPAPVDPADLVRVGADLQRLRAALAAEGVDSTLLPPPSGSTASATLAL